MTDKETKRYVFTKRQHIAVLTMLIVEFVLGVTLVTLVPYQPHATSNAHGIILDIHIGMGFLLLSTGIIRLVLSLTWHQNIRLLATLGLVSIIGAFVSGEATIHGVGEAAVFSMAMFFITAVIIYGLSQLRLKRETSSK